MKKLYSREVNEKAARFVACKSLMDLNKLGFDINQLQLMAINPPYYTFELPKKNGGKRKIEAPEEGLKLILKQFNSFLQCVYYTKQSRAAYGYIIRVRDKKHTKNILANAQKHLLAKYMLNVDFESFFHQVKIKQITKLLQNAPFNFETKVARLLSKLFTKSGRLPMGAPTSPVLSNFAALPLDLKLYEWAISEDLEFTRYVDDLTFSSKNIEINTEHLNTIKKICLSCNLKINPAKTKYYNEGNIKKVTGLVLRDTVDIEPRFYEELDADLKRLKHTAEVSLIMNRHLKNNMLRDFKQEVEGKINFIGVIEGYGSELFHQYRQQLKKALNPPDEVLSAKWTNSNYF